MDKDDKAALWARVKADHALGMTQVELMRRHGVTHSALNRRIRLEHWPRRNRSNVVDRSAIFMQLYRIVERLILDLEMEIAELVRAGKRTDASHLMRFIKLAGSFDKVLAYEREAQGQALQGTKAMQDIRDRLIERIEQLKRG